MLCICPLVVELTSVMLTRAHQRSKPNTPNALEEHDSYWNISSLDNWQQGHNQEPLKPFMVTHTFHGLPLNIAIAR